MKLSHESKQPRKQRKSVYTAPLHMRRKQMRAHLSRDLRKELKKRSAVVRKGDKVKIMAGEHAGATGAVTKVDYGELRVKVEGITARKQGGKEVQVDLHPSNLLIMERAPAKKKA